MPVNAKLDITVGLQIRFRNTAERFQPTRVWNSPYHLQTDLDRYTGVIGTLANQVYGEFLTQITSGNDVECHVGVRLDNPTHPTPGAGVVPLAKGNFDGQLAAGDFTSAQVLQTMIDTFVQSLAGTAKYTA